MDVQVNSQMPVRPKNLYGVSKCFGESLACYYAYQEDLPCIVVRIGCFEEFSKEKTETARDMSAFLSEKDLHQLLFRCVEAPSSIQFAIVHGISNNRFKRLDLTETSELLNYAPQDDAFKIREVGLIG